MAIKVGVDVIIEEPTGVSPPLYTYSDGNDRKITVMDGLRVRWGREDYLGHPSAAVAQFRLKDDTGEWIGRVRDNQAVGKRILLRAMPSDGSFPWWFFQGRITEANVTRGPIDKTTGLPKHYWVDITAADKIADLGNIIMPKGTVWPDSDTMLDRAVRVRDAALPVSMIGDFFFNPQTVSWGTAPVDVGGKSLLELTKTLYMSAGDTFSYIPSENNVRNMRRRDFDVKGQLHVMEPLGRRVGIRCTDMTFDSVLYRGIGVSGGHVVAEDEGLHTDPQGNVNRVEVSFKDSTAGHADRTIAKGVDADSYGRRTLTTESWLDNPGTIDTQTAPYLLDRATREGSYARHPAITWDTHATGDGFLDIEQAKALVLAGERMFTLFLYGSRWTTWMDNAAPLFGVLGGEMVYRDGRWIITMTLQKTYRASVTPLTWGQVHSDMKWGDTHPVGGSSLVFEDAVMWIDTRFVTDPALTNYDLTVR